MSQISEQGEKEIFDFNSEDSFTFKKTSNEDTYAPLPSVNLDEFLLEMKQVLDN
jgi:hypothetical protein